LPSRIILTPPTSAWLTNRKPERLPIKVDGALQISDLNADMVDVCSFEIDFFLSGGGRAARRWHSETLNHSRRESDLPRSELQYLR
jgi:hypothetical protein